MALEGLKRAVARSPAITRWLFSIRAPKGTAQGHWDYSTLALFSALRTRIAPGQRILELGTGEIGTLSIAMARRVSAQYLALDLDEGAVLSARRVAAENGVKVEFLRSDLLAEVPRDRSFDLTFFNPPYVPRALSERWKGSGEPSRVWDGGEDGLDVIRKFFAEAASHKSRLGTILIGFNRRSVPQEGVASIARSNGFSHQSTLPSRHPGTVAVFE